MQISHSHRQADRTQEIAATIDIPTSTAIIYKKDDPSQVLVGRSSKHSAPVLPGGKIDLNDIVSTSIELAARNCIVRELQEEVALIGVEPRFLFLHSDPTRDNRVITAKSLKGTIVEHLVQGLSDSQQILGRYGVPDYVFLVEVEGQSVTESTELEKLEWIDTRNIGKGSLAAGHERILAEWRRLSPKLGPA